MPPADAQELGDLVSSGHRPYMFGLTYHVVDIAESDVGFHSTGCGAWSNEPRAARPPRRRSPGNSTVGTLASPPTTETGNFRWRFTATIRISPTRFQEARPTRDARA